MKLKIFGGSRSSDSRIHFRKYGLPLSGSETAEAVKRDFLWMDAVHGGLLKKFSEILGGIEEIDETTDHLVGPEHRREVGFMIKTGKAKVKAHYNPYDSPVIEIVSGNEEWGFRREHTGDDIAGLPTTGKAHYVVYGTMSKESYYALIEPKSLKGKERLPGAISRKMCQQDDDGYFRGAVKAEVVPELVEQILHAGDWWRIGWPKSGKGIELLLYESFQRPTKVKKNEKPVSIVNEAEEIKDAFLEMDSFYDGIIKQVFEKLGGIDEIDAGVHSHRYHRNIHLKVAKDGKRLTVHDDGGFVCNNSIGVLVGDDYGGIFSKKNGDYWFRGVLMKKDYETMIEKRVVETGPWRWTGNGSWEGEVKVDARDVPGIIGRMMAEAWNETTNQRYLG